MVWKILCWRKSPSARKSRYNRTYQVRPWARARSSWCEAALSVSVRLACSLPLSALCTCFRSLPPPCCLACAYARGRGRGRAWWSPSHSVSVFVLLCLCVAVVSLVTTRTSTPRRHLPKCSRRRHLPTCSREKAVAQCSGQRARGWNPAYVNVLKRVLALATAVAFFRVSFSKMK